MSELRDLIIIGAGPAGLSTALHLNRNTRGRELDTLILERARHPRAKLCAGGILVEGEYILAKLGLDLTEIPHTDVESALFNFEGSGFKAYNLFAKKPIFRTVRRDEFDFWLAENAKARGIQLQEGVNVQKVEVFDDHVLVSTEDGETYRAKVVVGADGSKSTTRRALGAGKHPHVARALEVITPPLASSPAQNQASFDFLPIPQGISGYIWDFPALVQGEPMRCWGIYDSNIIKRKSREPLRDVLAAEMAAHGYNLDNYALKGHPIRWFEPAEKAAMPRILLVGDALGAGALLGEGISPALGYGRVAADEILRAFEKNDFSFQGYKRRLLFSGLGGSLWRRTFIASAFYLFSAGFWQILFWQIFGWISGLIGLLFVVGWEKRGAKKRSKR